MDKKIKTISASIKNDIYHIYEDNAKKLKKYLKEINEKLEPYTEQYAQMIIDSLVDLLIADYKSEETNNLAGNVIISLIKTDILFYLDKRKLLSGLDEDFCVKNFDAKTLLDCWQDKYIGFE